MPEYIPNIISLLDIRFYLVYLLLKLNQTSLLSIVIV